MTKTDKDLLAIRAALLLAVAMISFWMGRQTITLADLSQQQARDIAVALYQDCDAQFRRDARSAMVASNRCHNVADLAMELMYAAGVEKEDRVLERAKKMAKEARP